MLLVKSIGRQHQSTKKLSKRLKVTGYRASKSTVHIYLGKEIRVKAFKRAKKPKLTKQQEINQLTFGHKVNHWYVNEWKSVMWPDESHFELYHSANVQNIWHITV